MGTMQCVDERLPIFDANFLVTSPKNRSVEIKKEDGELSSWHRVIFQEEMYKPTPKVMTYFGRFAVIKTEKKEEEVRMTTKLV